MNGIENIQLPPNEFELEKMGLSSIMANIGNIDLLDEDCFYWESTKKIFNSINKTKSTDLMLISLDSGLSVDDIIEFVSNLVLTTSHGYIIEQLIKYRNARLLLRGVNKLENCARLLDIEKSIEVINKLSEVMSSVKEDKTIAEYGVDYFDDISAEKKNLKFGYKLLDEVVQIYGGQLITIAGRPSMGKTTVMQNIALRQSKKRKVGFISMEMQIFELMDRFVCISGGLTGLDIREKTQHKDRIYEQLGSIIENNLFLTESTYTLGKIEQFIVKNALDICHIDYLGLIQYGDSKTTIIARISEITRQLKMIAKRRNCCIILGCQLSRDVEKRNDKRPILADLRDSGTIEQDSDIVIMLYRDEYYDDSAEFKNKIDLLVRKQRNGELKTIKLDTKFSSYRIMDSGSIVNPF